MILVTGTGRSGTSDVARILHKLGVNMGDSLIPADKNNESGYFEDTDFIDLNKNFVKKWYPISKPEFRNKLKTLLKRRKEPFGIKDPMIAYILDEYLPYNPKIILCVRNKRDTVKSMMRVYDWTKEFSQELTEKRMSLLKQSLKGQKYLKIDCNDKDKENKIKDFIK